MYIDVIRGQELNVHISESLQDPENMMFPVFKQAMQALAGIVRQAREFDAGGLKESDFAWQEKLFRYSSNIIAFSGQRGGGKTSTMLSFSKIMRQMDTRRSCGREWAGDPETGILQEILGREDQRELKSAWEELKGASFIVLPPIEPSVLEGQQSILSVVLSRLFEYGEKLVQVNQDENNDENLECIQRELTRDFQNCLTGIQSIKYQKDAASWDLLSLQNISDGSILRKHFATLVKHLLKLTPRREGDTYLVLQLDDADSQIDHAYQVLEDVRRYLVVPRMIILMSADVNIFRQLVLEKYVAEFPTLRSVKEERKPLWEDLRRMRSKYLDKLIPSIQLVTLPLLDQMVVQEGDHLKLRYLKLMRKDGPRSEDYVFPWAQDAELGLQDFLLTAIYQKTGIIFASHTAYVNNIIPTTMRGIMHLLYLLTTMEDIPRHERDGMLTPENLRKLIERQLPIAEGNLSRFTRYFQEDWVNAKLTNIDDLTFLRKLSNSARSVQVQLTVDYLLKRYKGSLPQDFDAQTVNGLDKNSLILLEELMAKLHQTHRTQEDFNLAFAVHTLFTLGNHRAIWQQKRKEIQDPEKSPSELLVFDYAPAHTYLPDTYLIPGRIESFKVDSKEVHLAFDTKYEDAGQVYQAMGIDQQEEPSRAEQERFFVECMLQPSPRNKNHPRFHFMNFVSVLLRQSEVRAGIGKELPAEADEIGYGKTQQYRIYEMQEKALCIAANWDVQDHIFKFMRDRLRIGTLDFMPGETIDAEKLLGGIYDKVDEELIGLNSHMLVKILKEHKGGAPDDNLAKFNGIGQAFRYASVNGAMIGEVDVADRMRQVLRLNRDNKRALLEIEGKLKTQCNKSKYALNKEAIEFEIALAGDQAQKTDDPQNPSPNNPTGGCK